MNATNETLAPSAPAPALPAASEAALSETLNNALSAVFEKPAKAKKVFKARHNCSNLFKRGKVYWYKITINGEVIRKSLGRGITTKEAAKERVEKIKADLERDRWDRVWGSTAPTQVASVREVRDRYIASNLLAVAPNSKRKNVNDLVQFVAYVSGYKEVDGHWVGAPIDDEVALDKPITVVDSANAYAYQNIRLDREFKGALDRNSACISINSTLRGIRGMFSKACLKAGIYKGLNLDNSTSGRSVLGWVKHIAEFNGALRLKELPNDKYVPPPAEEVAAVFSAVMSELPDREPQQYAAFYLASMAGLRAGEIREARWGWILNDRIEVRKNIDTGWIPKGKRERFIPVVPAVRATLLELARKNGWNTSSNANIIAGSNSHKTVTFEALADFMKEHGWSRREKLHELRKLYATALCAKFGPYAAQQALGHAKLSTTTIYAARPEIHAIDPMELWLPVTKSATPALAEFSI